MSDAEGPTECPAVGSRPRATTRPVTIELDIEGSQLLASAASANATVAVYADEAATATELVELLCDLRVDLPVQGRRIGVFDREDGVESGDDHTATTQEES